jgi:hypothetical protein
VTIDVPPKPWAVRPSTRRIVSVADPLDHEVTGHRRK